MNTKLQERLHPLKGNWNKVAELAGVAPMTIYRIAWGHSKDHRMTTYQRISAAIDVVTLSVEAKKKTPA